MRWPRVRFTMRRIMVAVVIDAANLAYLRRYGRIGTLLGTCLPVLILQAGLLGALRSRDSTRRFWLGFVAFGSLALIRWCAVEGRFPQAADAYYGRVMDAVLGRFPLAGYYRLMVSEPSHQALAEVLLTIPQLLVSLVGGILALLLSYIMKSSAHGPAQVPNDHLHADRPEAPVGRSAVEPDPYTRELEMPLHDPSRVSLPAIQGASRNDGASPSRDHTRPYG